MPTLSRVTIVVLMPIKGHKFPRPISNEHLKQSGSLKRFQGIVLI